MGFYILICKRWSNMDWNDRRPCKNWVWSGLAVMFILIGVAAIIGVLSGNRDLLPGGIWNWVWNLIGLLIFLWFLLFLFRVFVRPLRYRKFNDFWGHEDSSEIIRRRYARGEITKEEYEQMMNDLSRYRN